MELHPILQFISQYGYWIAIPIMVIEGPIITIVMGFLASLGLFDILVVIFLSFISDIISDTIYYESGYHGGPKVLAKLKIPQVQENGELQELRKQLEQHPGKIFFAAKVLTGLAHSTFVLAGVTQVNYRKILKHSLPGGMIWSSGLAVLGFYFGKYATNISRFLSVTGLIMFGLLAALLFYKFWFGKFVARKYALWKQQNHR